MDRLHIEIKGLIALVGNIETVMGSNLDAIVAPVAQRSPAFEGIRYES